MELGRELGHRGRSPKAFRRAAHERLMGMVSSDDGLRAAAFRLVDVAPACRNDRELSDHFAAYLSQTDQDHGPARFGLRAARSSVLGPVTGRVSSLMVRQMARRFIVGETVADSAPTLRSLWRHGVASTVDLLGEATVSYEEGQAYADRCDDALLALSELTAKWPANQLLEMDSAGPLPRANLSVKVTALTPEVRAAAPDRGREDAARHLRRLFRRADELGAHLHVDMESMDSRDLVLDLVLDLLAEPEFANGPSVGLVLQAYLRDCEDTLDRILARAREAQRSVPLTIRLVKGAYWDHETIEAEQHGWVPPVWTEKADSDRSFELMSTRLIDAFPLVRSAFGSHNLRSIAFAATHARSAGLSPQDIEIQVLRGLGDELQEAVVRAGFRCRAY